jgi:hypothetical protein
LSPMGVGKLWASRYGGPKLVAGRRLDTGRRRNVDRIGSLLR